MRSVRAWLTVAFVPLAAWACEDIFGPGPACGEARDIRVCTDKGEYAPGSQLLLTVSNGRSMVAFLDRCSVQIASTARDVAELVGTYNPQRRCGFNVTPEEVIQNLIELAPGAEVTLEFEIGASGIQAFARSFVWVFDANMVLEPEPIGTSIFDIFRSAES